MPFEIKAPTRVAVLTKTMREESSNEVSRNVERVARSLFGDNAEREQFLRALSTGGGSITAVAALRGGAYHGAIDSKPPWLPGWISVAGEDERPGKSERHEQGELYCLDLSSTFACAAYSTIEGPVDLLVDLCAAPGGKSVLASRYLSPGFIVANEVIRKRTAQLISNYKRCSIDPAIVTSRDPSALAKLLPQAVRLLVADVPCSGQSLVVKGQAAPGAFHPATISMNARRQRRILACAAPMLQPGGYILYSTCTFSREENEQNIEWFLRQRPDFTVVSVPLLESFRSMHSSHPTYRLFPHTGFGAGSFCALLKREGEIGQLSAPSIEEATDAIKPIWRSSTVFKLLPAPIKSVGSGEPRGAERGKRRRGGKRSGRRAEFFGAEQDE
jgi:16S rRNA C967 or C1407 C5-methylase (RsmB/RsmF family)